MLRDDRVDLTDPILEDDDVSLAALVACGLARKGEKCRSQERKRHERGEVPVFHEISSGR